MSTIKVDTYQTRGGASEIAIDKLKGVTAVATINVVAEGGTNTTSLQQGLVKQFINIPADGASISDSFNVSSLDDDGTGDRGIHMTSNFGNITYMVLSGFEDTGEGSQNILGDVTQGTISTSAYDFEGYRSRSDITRTNRDNLTYLAVVGDLA